MTNDYASSVLSDIYAEGDWDCIFIDQLIGLIRYDQFDQDRGRESEEIVRGVLVLSAFLLRNGFFLTGTDSRKAGKYLETRDPIGAIEMYTRDALSSSNDFDQFAIALEKKEGTPLPSKFPSDILMLLS